MWINKLIKMNNIENITYDKSNWAKGEWDNEPDKIQWQDEAAGLPCIIVRNRMGGLCGYVGVPPLHPAHGGTYDGEHTVVLDVHGGLTFAGKCGRGPESESICHKPAEGESDDVWWLGFDCCHAGDFYPYMNKLRAQLPDLQAIHDDYRGLIPEDIYRDVAYVTKECEQLAIQLQEFVP